MCWGVIADVASKIGLGLVDRLRQKPGSTAANSVQADAGDRAYAGGFLRDRLHESQPEGGDGAADSDGPGHPGAD